MPVSLFPRFGKVDFFGILLPGLFMLCSIYVAVVAYGSKNTSTSPSQAFSWNDGAPVPWAILVLFVLFASYLLGSIPRAFVVGPTDSLCNWPCYWLRRAIRAAFKREMDLWRTTVRESRSFPYIEVLRQALKQLDKFKEDVGSVTLPEEKDHQGLVVVFDYWKHVLSMRAPPVFAVAELHEGRVRFFVGMFWAGAVGVVCAAATLVSCANVTDWGVLGTGHLGVSAFISLVFGIRLRFVRAEEATQVLLGYVAHRACLAGSAPGAQSGAASAST
jgi:hypothetical protein